MTDLRSIPTISNTFKVGVYTGYGRKTQETTSD